MNDSPDASPKETSDVVSKSWRDVAEYYPFWALVGTVSGYVYVYYYKAAYLRYFGIPNSYIEIAVSDLARAGALGISLLILAFYVLQLFPVALIKPLVTLILIFRYSAITGLSTFASFSSIGFSRWLLFLLFLFLSAMSFELLSLVLGLRKRGSLSAYCDSVEGCEKDVRERFLIHRVISSRHGHYFAFPLVLAFAIAFLGGYFGANAAKSVADIQLFERGSERFAVVLHSGSQILAVPVVETSKEAFQFEKSLIILNLDQQAELRTNILRVRLLAEDAIKAKSYPDFLAEECALNSLIVTTRLWPPLRVRAISGVPDTT